MILLKVRPHSAPREPRDRSLGIMNNCQLDVPVPPVMTFPDGFQISSVSFQVRNLGTVTALQVQHWIHSEHILCAPYIHSIYFFIYFLYHFHTILYMFWSCSGHVPDKFWGSKISFFQKVLGTFGLYFGIIGGVYGEVGKS